ncbi:sensor histidine kinase [Rhodothermus marinus]|uniref:sensor histidine kinase n=1 Tax=Rhodothermus marinus TaxID=29549 RepID=UPI0012BA506C|nr:ATP-binding protein [Rhodothermus marinus]BBM73740.1 hypothetical protein RmaAA338_26050 [Rhodothermus marinus]
MTGQTDTSIAYALTHAIRSLLTLASGAFRVPCVRLQLENNVWETEACATLRLDTAVLDAQVRARQAPLVLEDTDAAGVPRLRFYAGVPVGEAGVLALADVRPHRFGPEQRLHLETLAELAAQLWQQEKARRRQLRFERLLRQKAAILERMARGAPLQAVLEEIARWIESESASGALVSILMLRGDRVYHGAAPSLPEAYRRAIDGRQIGPAAGTCGTAAYHRTEVITEDIATDPRWEPYRAFALAHGLRACWSTPVLASDGTVLGTFALYYREPRRPDAQDRELVALATHLTAVALERARQQALLQTRERQLMAVLEQAGDAILLLDAEQRVTLFNRTAERLFACRAADILGQPVARLLPDLNEVPATTDEPVQLEAVRCDGTRFMAELSRTTLMSEASAESLLIVRDLTERLQHEAELIRAREEAEAMNRLKSTLLTNLSHELRTPLTTVIGFADVIREEAAPGTLFHEFAQLIADGGRRLLHLLEEVMDLAQLEAQTLKAGRERLLLPERLRPLMATYRARAEQKGLKFRVQQAPGVAVWADPELLERAVEHLLDNAIKFTERGGVTVRFRQVEDQVGIVVEDTGIGIPEAALPHVFDEFWQASSGIGRTHEGLGLGLAVARRFVEIMGGRIEVESTPGRGSRFTIWLPAAPLTTPVPRS